MSFKLLAIRPLEGCNKKFLKNLEENRIYKFYQDYNFLNNDEEIKNFTEHIEVDKIEYTPTIPENFYGDKNININISAIVGKNGSGKSALVEMLYAAFYNISIDLKLFKETNKKEDIYCELYYRRFNKDLSIYEFSVIKLTKEVPSSILSNLNDKNKFDIDYDLFYNIITNYSFYGLNSNFTGKWIEKLFHKNDGYQVPIVLNPMRTEGIIDINTEYDLAKDRLLSNILNNSEIDKNAKLLIENKKVIGLTLKLKDRKYKLTDKEELEKENITKKYLLKIFNSFKIDSDFEIDIEKTKIDEIINSKNIVIKTAIDYILYKLQKMSSIYAKEDTNFNKINYFEESTVNNFLDNIIKNDFGSHITFKIRQAINFLKYDLYPKEVDISYYNQELEQISNEIYSLRQNLISNNKNKISEKHPNTKIIFPFWLLSNVSLIPPSIYEIDYEFEDVSKFSLLSSGETQKIFSISTILYHIINVSSKHHNYLFSNKNLETENKKKDIKYSSINIILDEIELYAHPEMQRTFIKELIDKLKNAYLSGIKSVNLLFITHSPFILSDIPKQNILFLDVIKKVDEGGKPILDKNKNEQSFSTPKEYKGDNTFGENIHQMLIDGFFISSTKGAFSISKINEFLAFYKKSYETKKDSKEYDNYKSEFKANKDDFTKLITIVGEDYVRKILENHFEELQLHFGDKNLLNIEEDKLRKRLEEIEKLKKSSNDKN